jgi:hypothetical protein
MLSDIARQTKWLKIQTNLDLSLSDYDTSLHIAIKCTDGYAIVSLQSLNVGYDNSFLGMTKREMLMKWNEEVIRQLATMELEKE